MTWAVFEDHAMRIEPFMRKLSRGEAIGGGDLERLREPLVMGKP